MLIHIAVYEPSPEYGGVGGFEWKTNVEAALKAYRGFRSDSGTALLFTNVTVPAEVERQAESDPGYITDWVDYTIWVGAMPGMVTAFGRPTATYERP